MIVHILIHAVVSVLIACLALIVVVGLIALYFAVFGGHPQSWHAAADTVVSTLARSLTTLLYGLAP
ncbi:hypothetical protein [Actinoalloteichus caeruleus]|uniref:hypothetical protein n=1 Tax=Actinoalloteichus cyanogriseus TaxID=2893586 RepID=UPI003AB042F1